MKQKISQILKEELAKIKPDEKEIKRYSEEMKALIENLGKKLKGKANVMLGGSFAKNTVIKKDRYDADIFIRFFKNPDSRILEKILKNLNLKFETLHGSRDYFRIKSRGIFIEIVPIMNLKADETEKAANVTDVSPFHVYYISKKIEKNQKLADEIRLAKALCYALDCYGAESHIRGFSGYCLEVLVSYYGSFLRLLEAASKWPDKVVIDPEKYYKSRDEILRELNESKLISPLVIVDPVQKNRNISAALSDEKFNAFRDACKKFLAHPSQGFFRKKDMEKEILENAKKSKKELLVIEAESFKEKEDIAGAKLLKFMNVLKTRLENEGYSAKSGIKFLGRKARLYFLLGKKDIIIEGPFLDMKKHVENFKKTWKSAKARGKRMIAVKKASEISWRNALKIEKKTLKEMSIKKFNVVKA
jgi:tRNA nucleotidyltransferase (CCA-adding enzyme)